jgi:hypothetical protein
MSSDFQRACEAVGFDEGKFVEAVDILFKAEDNKTNLFSRELPNSHNKLPDGVKPGSKEHASYLFFMTHADKFVVADELYANGRELYGTNPEVFDAERVYTDNKDNLDYYVRKGKHGGKVLFAPELNEKIKVLNGLSMQISGDWYRSARKLHLVYHDDPRKIFDCVTDINVAMSRLDVGKQNDSITLELADLSKPRFGSVRGKKQAPLVIYRFIENGIIQNMDTTRGYLPMDTHIINFLISHGIVNLKDEMRVPTFVSNAQTAVREVCIKHNIPQMRLHYSGWHHGNKVCRYQGCFEDTEDNVRKCVYAEPCQKELSVEMYRKGKIVAIPTVYAKKHRPCQKAP